MPTDLTDLRARLRPWCGWRETQAERWTRELLATAQARVEFGQGLGQRPRGPLWPTALLVDDDGELRRVPVELVIEELGSGWRLVDGDDPRLRLTDTNASLTE